MTTQTAAAASKTDQKGVATRGVLVALDEKSAKNGAVYVTGKIDAVKLDGTVAFTRAFICFKAEAVAALKDMGIGARVYTYGYFDKQEAEGGKYTRQSYRVIDARPNQAREETAETASAEVAAESKGPIPF